MDKKRLLDRFLRYVTCSSESGYEKNFCELIETELQDLGLSVQRDEVGKCCNSNGWNIYAFLPGKGEPFLFSAHLDTVTPGRDIRPVIQDGIIRSAGDTILGSDDKSGIAAVMEALETIQEENISNRPVEILFSVCEESGLLGAKYADYSKIKSKNAIVLDNGSKDQIVNRAPANMHLHIEIMGKSAHAGISPDKGIHALKAAAAAINQIPCGFVDDRTVMNVSNLLAPGKTNVVSEKATFDMEIRSFDEEYLLRHIQNTEKAVKDACELFGATYTIQQEKHSDVLYVPEDSPLVTKIKNVFSSLGVELKVDKTYGGCDATWLFYHGIDALNIGTGMQEPHALTEHIAISDLELTAEAVLRFMLADE